MNKGDFDQQLECATPKHRSKYTTLTILVYLLVDQFPEFLRHPRDETSHCDFSRPNLKSGRRFCQNQTDAKNENKTSLKLSLIKCLTWSKSRWNNKSDCSSIFMNYIF